MPAPVAFTPTLHPRGPQPTGRARVGNPGALVGMEHAPGCDTLPVADLSGAIPVMGLWAMAAAQRDDPLG